MTASKVGPLENRENPGVLKVFKPVAICGLILGIFPVPNVLKPHPGINKPWKFQLYSVLLVSFFSVLLLQPTVYYLKQVETGLKIRSTDIFALRVFVMTLVLLRFVPPVLSVLIAKRLAGLLSSLQEYDTQFQVKARTRLVDAHVAVLFGGTVAFLLFEWYATQEDFQMMFNKYQDGTIVTFILASYLDNSELSRTLITISAHLYGELALLFLVATMMFLIKCLITRFEELETYIRHVVTICKSNLKERNTSDSKYVVMITPLEGDLRMSPKKHLEFLFSERDRDVQNVEPVHLANRCFGKLRGIIAMVQDFNHVFGLFALLLFIIHWALLLSSCHLVLTSMVYIFPDVKSSNLKNDEAEVVTVAVGLVSGMFRVAILTEMGERLQNSGYRLAKTLSSVSTATLADPVHRQIEDMRWCVNNAQLTVNTCHFFVLNRRLILSLVGSIATFTVVLTQFRMAETSEQR